jgi:opacity protein-like surface antigen
MCKRLFLIIILAALFYIAESDAQSRNSSHGIGIGPQIGFQKAGDADEGRLMFGGFLRLKVSDALGFEGSINYRTEQYANDMITVRSWPVLASVLFYPVPIVYGIAGAGWYNTTFDFDPGFQQLDLDDKTETNFGWHIGAGAEIPVAENIKLTGDIKYVFLNYDWEDLGDTPLNDFNSNFYIINVGLAFGLR